MKKQSKSAKEKKAQKVIDQLKNDGSGRYDARGAFNKLLNAAAKPKK